MSETEESQLVAIQNHTNLIPRPTRARYKAIQIICTVALSTSLCFLIQYQHIIRATLVTSKAILDPSESHLKKCQAYVDLLCAITPLGKLPRQEFVRELTTVLKERAIAESILALGPDNDEELHILILYNYRLDEWRNFSQSKSNILRFLEICRRRWGTRSSEFATALRELAHIEEELGDKIAADQHYRSSICTFFTVDSFFINRNVGFHTDHLRGALAAVDPSWRNNESHTPIRLGLWGLPEWQFPTELDDMLREAHRSRSNRDLVKAERLYLKALSGLSTEKKSSVIQSQIIATVRNEYAGLLQVQGRAKEAREMERQVDQTRAQLGFNVDECLLKGKLSRTAVDVSKKGMRALQR